MALQQAVGTTIGVSVALPTTWDDDPATGFPSLDYDTVGRLTSVPDLDGEYDIATFDDLSTGEEIKFADMFRAGEGSFVVGLSGDDVGQVALEGAKGEKVALEITLKDGTKYYRSSIVRSYAPSNIVVGGVVQAEVSLAFERNSVKVAPTP